MSPATPEKGGHSESDRAREIMAEGLRRPVRVDGENYNRIAAPGTTGTTPVRREDETPAVKSPAVRGFDSVEAARAYQLQAQASAREARDKAELVARIARLEANLLGYSTVQSGGGGGGGGPTDLQVRKVDATHVRVTNGTVSLSLVPAIGSGTVASDPPATLEVTASGWIVLVTTWPDDYLPRNLPLTAEFVFEAGDPDSGYTPASPDTRTQSRLPHGRVWVESGAITKVATTPMGSTIVNRQIYDEFFFEFVYITI